MENHKTTIVIVALIIFVLIVWYFANKKNSEKSGGTSSNTINDGGSSTSSTSANTNTSHTNTNTSTPTHSNTNTSTPTHSNTNTSTPSSTPPNTNQITIKKSTPTYYQVKNVANPTYPMTYSGPVAGITFENGKVLTLLKMVQGMSGEGKLYETTEPVPSGLTTSHPEISAHLFVKETDLI